MAVTLSDIHATEEYKNLLIIGCIDLGSATRSNRPELKINVAHPILGEYTSSRGKYLGNYTVFQTGYIRLFLDRPSMIRNAINMDKKYVMDIREWENHLRIVENDLLRAIMGDKMGLGHSTINHVLSFPTLKKKFEELLSGMPNAFINWVRGLENENVEAILDLVSDDIAKRIASNPGQWAHTLKSIHKNPAVARIVKKLSPGVAHTFSGDLGLTGDLYDLGF